VADSERRAFDVGFAALRWLRAGVAALGFAAFGFATFGVTTLGFAALGFAAVGFAVWLAPATQTGAPACAAFAGWAPGLTVRPPAQAPTVAAPATPRVTAARVRGRRLRR
jgi:hypothetical protein